jgi:hypothetical protein
MLMPSTKFSIRRLLLGTVFVALPFSAFGGFGLNGVIVSIFIAVPMFIACCVASRDQLQSMFGIIACTTFGLFIGALIPSVGRPYDMAMQINFYAISGCVVGLLWSEFFYAKQARGRASQTIADQCTTDDKSELTNKRLQPSPRSAALTCVESTPRAG